MNIDWSKTINYRRMIWTLHNDEVHVLFEKRCSDDSRMEYVWFNTCYTYKHFPKFAKAIMRMATIARRLLEWKAALVAGGVF